MSVRARIPSISRDIDLLIADTLSPAARSRQLADYGREQLAVAQAQNRQALGRVPPHDSFVDGKSTDDLDSVKPEGAITFEFQLLSEVLEWIGEQLVLNSPVLSGAYANSHAVFVDGVEAVAGQVPLDGREWVFVNTVPYARKIERGLSPQAPDGVYEAVAAVAKSRFGNMAHVRFSYRSLQGGAVVNYKGVGDRASVSRNRKGQFARGSGAGGLSAEQRAAHSREHQTRHPAIVVTI